MIQLNNDKMMKINIYDYNYNLAKKFKYLKNELIIISDIILIAISIYDKVKYNIIIIKREV